MQHQISFGDLPFGVAKEVAACKTTVPLRWESCWAICFSLDSNAFEPLLVRLRNVSPSDAVWISVENLTVRAFEFHRLASRDLFRDDFKPKATKRVKRRRAFASREICGN